MDNFDPSDFYEPDDYEAFEQKYADELNELSAFEEEEIDFNVVLKPNRKPKEDKKLDSKELKGDLPPQDNRLPKRNCSQIDVSCTETKENISPLCLKPKKLKLDDELDFDFDWDIKTCNTNTQKDKHSKVIEKLKYQPSLDDSFNEESYNMSRQRVFCRPVFGVDLLNVTSTDGDRVFLKLCSEADIPTVEEKRWLSHSSTSGLNLLSVPFDQLKNEVQQKIHTRKMIQNLSEKKEEEAIIVNQKEVRDTKSMELWVEKYTPRRYTDLLSDDGTNRFVLKWLKLWDQVVFGIEPVKQKASTNDENGPSAGNFLKKDGKMNFEKKKYYDPEDDLIKDSKGRPKKKIALLCGNPGLGKTTLAHVISEHAGYQVVEINASDDRTPEVFLNKIETSTQMKSVIGHTKRPNCLIIDEIDGAPIQAINILLELVKTTDSATGKGTKLKKKRKKREFVLNRPIICICNDQFVPALRQLRQVAFTLKFPPTLPSRLAGRLLAISQCEHLRIDMGALLFLADKAENDIRSCLNTLQFIQQKKKHVKPEDLKNLEIGQKDMKKGVHVILNEVFQLPKSNKKKFIGQSGGGDSKSSLTNRFHYILHLVSGCSEHEKLMQGLFDQYLLSKTKDPYLESVNLGNEWFGFTDVLQKKVSSNQDYVLWRFLPFLPVAFHIYFAKATCGRVQYSNVSYENYLKLTHNKQTLELLTNGMNPHTRRNCSASVMTTDVVPYLYLITLPNLRPVNTTLYSESEKQIFLSLVNTLISYNLTYRQERNLEGQYTYVLEPNIEELVTYPGLPQHRQLLYATKQLIGREVEMEKMRQADRVIKRADEVNEISTNTSGSKTAGNIVKRQKIVPKKIERFADQPQLDFFGRVVKPDTNKTTESKTKKSKKDGKTTLVINTSTRFLFNEGYTNAVRRTIKVSEFL